MSFETSVQGRCNSSREAGNFRYAVIDLANAPALRPIIFKHNRLGAETLLARHLPTELLAVGPWLVRVNRITGLQEKLDVMDAEAPWGFFLFASVDIISIRQTLRRFNLVEVPNPNRKVLFRYWDPRVMNSFLSVATRVQRRRLFEFIDRLEGPGGCFRADASGAQKLM